MYRSCVTKLCVEHRARCNNLSFRLLPIDFYVRLKPRARQDLHARPSVAMPRHKFFERRGENKPETFAIVLSFPILFQLFRNHALAIYSVTRKSTESSSSYRSGRVNRCQVRRSKVNEEFTFV